MIDDDLLEAAKCGTTFNGRGKPERVEIDGEHFKGKNATACPCPAVKEQALEKQVAGNHYKGMVIQPVEFCQRNQLPYCESNAIKYVCRHHMKGGAADIKKAIHYLELLMQLEYPDAT